MSKSTDDFFEDKRPWSLIKDNVLNGYMSPYLAKVNTRKKPILLIDGYAGPGIFADGTKGSPFIMCQAAEKYAKGNWEAIFINKEQEYHEKLSQLLLRAGWLGPAQPKLGDSTTLLKNLIPTLKDQTVFLYLDPFGPTGCEFALLEPFLKRNPNFSTEIILTMNIPGLYRFATRHAVEKGRQDEQTIKGLHDILTKVLGGEYWKNILWRSDIDAETQAYQLIEAYCNKLKDYLLYTGFCPVRERTDTRIKYFIVFASGHRDSLLLLNDIMAKAYFAGVHKGDFQDGLWEGTDWRDMRFIGDLEKVILDMVIQHPGETRKFIWFRSAQKYFMRYLESEYKKDVQALVDQNHLHTRTPHKLKHLNDHCTLFPGPASH